MPLGDLFTMPAQLSLGCSRTVPGGDGGRGGDGDGGDGDGGLGPGPGGGPGGGGVFGHGLEQVKDVTPCVWVGLSAPPSFRSHLAFACWG